MDRNKLKRRLRELSRLCLLPADLAMDVVLRIRPDAYQASYEALAADIERALTHLHRLHPASADGTNAGPTA